MGGLGVTDAVCDASIVAWQGRSTRQNLVRLLVFESAGFTCGKSYLSSGMAVVRLESVVQYYDWGSRDSLSEVLGRTPSGLPEAELWMGTHKRGPSPLAVPQGELRDLSQLVHSDAARFLGEKVVATYGDLPFLFKVLAAGRPLSLQAHPNREQAQAGFQQEELRGVPVGDSRRNYRDPNHKPELICALTPFVALAGFRTPAEAAALSSLFLGNEPGQVGELSRTFSDAPNAPGLEGYLRALFSLDPSSLETAIFFAKSVEIDDGASAAVRTYAPWLRRLAELYPKDPGVLASMLLNLVELAPGEAMFLPAGNLHAYLEGVGLELMACSDNVLRGGLTSKHVDVAELFKVLVFTSFPPDIQKGVQQVERGATWRRFVTQAEEFELTLLDLDRVDALECSPLGPEVWLGLEGEIELSTERETVRLAKGNQVFVSSSTSLAVSGIGKAARAALPR